MANPIFLGTEIQEKILNDLFMEEVRRNHTNFEKKIARATGNGVVTIKVNPPRASGRNAWVISIRCQETASQLAEIYRQLVNHDDHPGTELTCAGTRLEPDTRIHEILWRSWPPEVNASR